jgi:hypothetical protein
MEVSLITGDCSNVGITYTIVGCVALSSFLCKVEDVALGLPLNWVAI